MGKFDGLLLVSDFDDTLYDFHHRIPPGIWRPWGAGLARAAGSQWPPGGPTAPLPLMPTWPHQRPGGAVQRLDHLRLPDGDHAGPDPAGRPGSGDFQTLMEAMPSLGLETYHGEGHLCVPPQCHHRRPHEEGGHRL